MYTTLIEPAELAAHTADPNWVIVDCRFDLARPESAADLRVLADRKGGRGQGAGPGELRTPGWPQRSGSQRRRGSAAGFRAALQARPPAGLRLRDRTVVGMSRVPLFGGMRIAFRLDGLFFCAPGLAEP